MRSALFRKSFTLNDISTVVEEFWQVAHSYRLFAFSGEMGAGKTTFIHYLCDMLQVEDSVSSPTFALINEYHYRFEGTDRMIYHMDWYRLKDAAEAINAGMEDCILTAVEGKATCFVEWPEKAPELIRQPYLWITIETEGTDQRMISVDLFSE